MCELFGLNSAEKVNCNELLETFFQPRRDQSGRLGTGSF